jgi:hypothetical protein
VQYQWLRNIGSLWRFVTLQRKADEKMANILLLATAWGPKHGGINRVVPQ